MLLEDNDINDHPHQKKKRLNGCWKDCAYELKCLLWLSNGWAETISKHPYSILFLHLLGTCHNNPRQITIMREHMAFEECQHQGDSMTYRVLWGEMGASLVAQTVKCLPAMQETWVPSLGGKIPWRRKWQPTPVLLPGKFHEQRSLVGYSPWACKQLDMTERLHIRGNNKATTHIKYRTLVPEES